MSSSPSLVSRSRKSRIASTELVPLGRKSAKRPCKIAATVRPHEQGSSLTVGGVEPVVNNDATGTDLAAADDEVTPPATNATSSSSRGRAAVPIAVPNAPPPAVSTQSVRPLLSDVAGISADELYGNDERALNQFLTLHPMLALDATKSCHLQLISNMFQKASIPAIELPVIPKSYDDMFLRPNNNQIGERACTCGDRCLAKTMAVMRHGPDTDLAFVATEFLLPDERTKFLNGLGLPTRRKKCLLCMRYFTNYVYIQACAHHANLPKGYAT